MKKLLIHSNGQLSIVGEGIDIAFKDVQTVQTDLPEGISNLDGLETAKEGSTVIVKHDGKEVAKVNFN